jgi:ech hydrogenase subunit A
MVAPTPVSALLHSSTMVKAGVYIIIKVAPAMQNTMAADMLSHIGGVTFLAASFIAISQSNAKKVLAYSTIANLGLVVACAAINTGEAMWSAILLIVFHAVAKSLMFLCVGIAELRLNSKDIEHMDFLIMEMPRVSAAMIVGISGMFLAPFGMLISKWATLKAFIDFNPILVIILAYGSAATLFFWTKWMGKIITIRYGLKNLEKVVSPYEWITLALLSLMTVGVCIAFPLLSSALIEPYIGVLFGVRPHMDPFNIAIIMVIMLGLLTMLPLALMYYNFLDKDYKRVGTYMSGANVDNIRYRGSMGDARTADIRNYYLGKFFSEKRLSNFGTVAAIFLIIIMLGVAVL